MNLADWGHRHAKALLFVTILLTLAGAVMAVQLPVALFPRVSFPRIVVSADAGDMPVEEMVASVTRPLEEAVNSVPGVVNVRSTTSRGAADLSINLNWGADMDQTYLLVQSRMEQIRSELPPDIHLTTRRMDPTAYQVLGYSLTSKTRSPVELKNLALYTLRPILGRVPGVAQVEVIGGQTREALVEVNPAKLLAYHLSLAQVNSALQNTNEREAVGKLEQNYRLYLTLVDGHFTSIPQIANTVVTTVRGLPITVGDVATVRPSTEPQWIRVTADGQDAVLMNVLQQPGGNTVAIDDEIKQKLGELKSQLPGDVVLSQYYDQADLIRESMQSVRDSILVGIVLGALVLLFFLRNARITLIAVASVPVTMAVSILLLGAMGQSINIMTLGGLAAAVGLVIDDAIVMVESIVHHLQGGEGSALAATRAALKEQWKPFLGSSLSSIIVFVPLAFLSGVTGAFFKSLSLTMAACLVISLLLAVLIVPLMVGHFVKVGPQLPKIEHREPGLLERAYTQVMRWLLPRPWVSVLLSAAILLGSWSLYRVLPNGFLPDMDEGCFTLDYKTDPGTSVTETDRVVKRIESIILKIPELKSYSRRTGAQLGGALTESNQGDILVRLNAHRKRGIEEIMDDTRTDIESSVPGVHVEFTQLMEDMIGDLTEVPQPVEIKVFGSDPAALRQVATQIADVIPKVPGVVDVFNGITVAGPSMLFKVDPLEAGRYGLNAEAVRSAVQTGLEGTVATHMLQSDHMIGVRVRYPEIARNDPSALGQLQVPTPGGQTVALGRVASLVVEPGNTEVNRENVKPMVAVTARIEGQSLGGTIDRIKSLIKRSVVLPPGVYLEYGGLYHQQQESFQGLAIVMLAAMMLVFALLLFLFHSFAAAIAIALVDALATLGILGALWVTGTPLNISSLMGTVMIIGIVAENAIFLLHAVHTQHQSGKTLHEALIAGGLARARAIAMTTMAAVLALLPLALGIGAGAQMQRPLAIAVIGGFSLSSLLLLFMLPALYALLVREAPVLAGDL